MYQQLILRVSFLIFTYITRNLRRTHLDSSCSIIIQQDQDPVNNQHRNGFVLFISDDRSAYLNIVLDDSTVILTRTKNF